MDRQTLIAGYLQNMGLMHRRMFLSWPNAGKHAPTRAQFGLMMLISHGELSGIKELAEKLCMSSSAVTQLVDGLVAEGLLLRKTDGTDRRKIDLVLTKKGKGILAKVRASRLAVLGKILKPLTDAELKHLFALQQKIINHLPHP